MTPGAIDDTGVVLAPDDAGEGASGLGGGTAACLAGGNLLHFQGPSFTSNQSLLVSDAVWSSEMNANDETVSMEVTEADNTTYYLVFSSAGLGTPLHVGSYENAVRAPSPTPGQPTMDVNGGGRGCNSLNGSFRLDAIASTPDGGVQEFTAAFEMVCDGETSQPPLQGCVHYAAQNP